MHCSTFTMFSLVWGRTIKTKNKWFLPKFPSNLSILESFSRQSVFAELVRTTVIVFAYRKIRKPSRSVAIWFRGPRFAYQCIKLSWGGPSREPWKRKLAKTIALSVKDVHGLLRNGYACRNCDILCFLSKTIILTNLYVNHSSRSHCAHSYVCKYREGMALLFLACQALYTKV